MKASHRVLKSASYVPTVGIVLCLVLLGAVAAWGDPPVTINIRGQLLNPQGQALPGAREYRVQFYDAGTDGTALGAALTGTAEVSLEGLFNVEAALPASALSAVELWYEFTISSAATAGPLTGSDTFPNRVKVVSVPFALESGTVTHVDVSAIGSGTVLDAEFGYLTGLTGGIQGQLDAKANSADVYTKTDADSRYATASHIHDGANITTGKIDNARLKTGADNGLDADTVDGAHASDFATASHTQDWTTITGAPTTFTPSAHFHSGADITSGKVDNAFLHTGAGNELDADKVDGAHASDFASASHNHDTSYWKLGGNSGTTAGTNYLGTSDNVALELRANGVRAFRLEPNTTSPNVIGGYLGNTVTSGIYGATIGGGGYSGNVNTVSGNYGTVAGGRSNTASNSSATVGGGTSNTASGALSTVAGGLNNTASANFSTVSGGSGNTATGFASAVAGGYDNTASADYATVAGGGPTDEYHPTTTNNNAYSPYCTVGGGGGNKAGVSGSTSITYATVAGGAGNMATGTSSMVGGGLTNTANASYAFVGGGRDNRASNETSIVGGGQANTASGTSATVSGGTSNTGSSDYATVAGGCFNAASNTGATASGGSSNTSSAYHSTVSGGVYNTANGYCSTVGGGYTNTASGMYSTVAAGYNNTAAGDYSFCAGLRAKATADADGSFVWADSTDADFSCAAHDRFQVRASGGVYLYTNASLTSGLYLGGGSGTWASLSDRNMKDNFEPIDAVAALDAVVALPISTWNYKSQDPSIRHMGPMAQDLYAAFHLGESDTTIATIDADGVSLAAIQGLNQKVEAQAVTIKAQATTITEQAAAISAQDTKIQSMESRLADLEALVQQLAAK